MEAGPTHTTVTRLIGELADGDPHAIDDLFTHVYDALKEIARRQRRRWRDEPTLNTTVLLHEAYLKLVDQHGIRVESRGHFFALAARAMRHILCNHARERQALKRGGGRVLLPLDEHVAHAEAARAPSLDDPTDALVSLDDALRRLERAEPRQARVIECRFFGGLTVEETAAALGISPRTVKRDWAVAQAWLHREMTPR